MGPISCALGHFRGILGVLLDTIIVRLDVFSKFYPLHKSAPDESVQFKPIEGVDLLLQLLLFKVAGNGPGYPGYTSLTHSCCSGRLSINEEEEKYQKLHTQTAIVCLIENYTLFCHNLLILYPTDCTKYSALILTEVI